MHKVTFSKNGVLLEDAGRPEYLEHAQMQYSVYFKGAGTPPWGETIAYFGSEEDALLFAKAKARRRVKRKEDSK